MFSRSSTSDFLRSNNNRILVNVVNISFYFSVVCASLKKSAWCVIGTHPFATLHHQGLKTTWIPTRSSQMLLTQGRFSLILVKVINTRQFTTMIFSATHCCVIVATLFRMVATLFQYCNAVLHLKSSLRIIPCNITFNDLFLPCQLGKWTLKVTCPARKSTCARLKDRAFF